VKVAMANATVRDLDLYAKRPERRGLVGMRDQHLFGRQSGERGDRQGHSSERSKTLLGEDAPRPNRHFELLDGELELALSARSFRRRLVNLRDALLDLVDFFLVLHVRVSLFGLRILRPMNAFGHLNQVSQRLDPAKLQADIGDIDAELGPQADGEGDERERLYREVVAKRETQMERVARGHAVRELTNQALDLRLRRFGGALAHYVG
jgi:hypothetical protein